MSNTALYDHLASILSYPSEQITDDVSRVFDLAPEDAQALQPFADYIKDTDMKSVEELFTRTFDLNPSCCLEVGWHLYGEDYQRGAFLVNMRQTLLEEGLPETVELPDHLSHCLRLLPRLDPEDAGIFVQKFLSPAIAKIQKAMEQENPYTCVIGTLKHLLERKYGAGETDGEADKARRIDLPVLNNVLHYHNTEDMEEYKTR